MYTLHAHFFLLNSLLYVTPRLFQSLDHRQWERRSEGLSVCIMNTYS